MDSSVDIGRCIKITVSEETTSAHYHGDRPTFFSLYDIKKNSGTFPNN